jgi:hypothetical protein
MDLKLCKNGYPGFLNTPFTLEVIRTPAYNKQNHPINSPNITAGPDPEEETLLGLITINHKETMPR